MANQSLLLCQRPPKHVPCPIDITSGLFRPISYTSRGDGAGGVDEACGCMRCNRGGWLLRIERKREAYTCLCGCV